MIGKECEKHGKFEDVYWSDVEMFLKAERYAKDGIGVENPYIKDAEICPFECGLCNLHLSHTSLALLDVTNRCNLKCPICFANAEAAGYVFEPTYDQIVEMMKVLRGQKPVPTPAIQFSGGEPTIREDFVEIVKKARELGFAQIQVATNGIVLAKDEDYAQKLVDAGMNTVYLQFDGFDDEMYKKVRGRKLLKIKYKAIENCRKTKPKPLATILVPTIINGINDGEVGEMLKFAIKNNDVLRGVNYQPVSFTGRIDLNELKKQRFTLPDLAERLEEQTDFLKKDDFYPVPCVAPISELASLISGAPKVSFTTHPHCGIATLLFINKENKEVLPITRIMDVEKFLREVEKIAEEIKKSKTPRLSAIKKSTRLYKYFKDIDLPGINLRKLIINVMLLGNKKSLADLHWGITYVGAMHFQDLYNYDIERVKRCAIHYVVPDGRIIPFCAYNGGPTFREEVEREFSIPLDEWKRRKKGKKQN